MKLLSLISRSISIWVVLMWWSTQAFAVYPCPNGPGPYDVAVGKSPQGYLMCEARNNSGGTAAPLPLPIGPRDMFWSALAMDKKKLLVTDKEMKFIGVSSGQKDQKVAQKMALDMCKSDGSTDCEIVDTVINSCLAISISSEANKLEYVFIANMQLAKQQSLQKCNEKYKGCKPAYAAC